MTIMQKELRVYNMYAKWLGSCRTRLLGVNLTLKVLNFWKFTSYCSLKPLWSGMGEVVPARTSPTLHPPSPPTVHQLMFLQLPGESRGHCMGNVRCQLTVALCIDRNRRPRHVFSFHPAAHYLSHSGNVITFTRQPLFIGCPFKYLQGCKCACLPMQ